MDGEAGWGDASGNIGLPPLARVMRVGRQQHVTPAAPESYVTVVRRSYPKRLNLTSNKSARVSNASRESGSRVSKESSNARRYVRRGGITGNSTSGGLRATPLPVRDLFVYRVNSDDTTDVLMWLST